MMLKLVIANSELGDLIVKKELQYDFNGPKNNSAIISKRLIDDFTGPNEMKELTSLAEELRRKYRSEV